MFATVQSQYVTANYFDALRIGMAAGRGFLPGGGGLPDPKAVVVISERVWREYFASDPGLVGNPIRVGDLLATVVGVAERGFAGVRGSIRVDLWLPLPTVAIAYRRKFSAGWLRSFDNPRQIFRAGVRPAAAGSDRRRSQGGARRAQPSVPDARWRWKRPVCWWRIRGRSRRITRTSAAGCRRSRSCCSRSFS